MTIDFALDAGAEEFLQDVFALGPCGRCSRGIEFHKASPFFGSYNLECYAEVVRELAHEADDDQRPLPAIEDLIKRKALFFANLSAGKDGQAMLIKLQEIIPPEQLLIIHSHLEGVEWKGSVEFIQKYARGTPVHVVEAKKTFLGMVEARWRTLRAMGKHDVSPWPSPKYRQCTSDLKRGPLEKEIRRIMSERGLSLLVNCMGLRAQESENRKKQKPLRYNPGNSKGGREWYDWLPIHDMSTDEVFSTIRGAGQEPFWVYAEGMSRKSCCFCIMSSLSDLMTAARLSYGTLCEIVWLERRTGHSMLMPTKKHGKRNLDEVLGVYVPPQEATEEPLAAAA